MEISYKHTQHTVELFKLNFQKLSPFEKLSRKIQLIVDHKLGSNDKDFSQNGIKELGKLLNNINKKNDTFTVKRILELLGTIKVKIEPAKYVRTTDMPKPVEEKPLADFLVDAATSRKRATLETIIVAGNLHRTCSNTRQFTEEEKQTFRGELSVHRNGIIEVSKLAETLGLIFRGRNPLVKITDIV